MLGIGTIWLVLHSNPEIFRRTDPQLSTYELALYALAVVATVIGWAFNIAFVTKYADGFATNPFWGDASWGHYLQLIFANPASGSAAEDFSISNVLLLPLVCIPGGRRLGIKRPYLFFVLTLFASFTAGWAFYVATAERQRRLRLVETPELVAA